MPQHCQELFVYQFQEEYADISRQESLEEYLLGSAERGFQGLDVRLGCIEPSKQEKVKGLQGRYLRRPANEHWHREGPN